MLSVCFLSGFASQEEEYLAKKAEEEQKMIDLEERLDITSHVSQRIDRDSYDG